MSAIIALYDARNAFGSTDHEKACNMIEEQYNKHEAGYLADLVEWGHFHLEGCDRTITLMPTQGHMMGHHWAPELFNRDYGGRLNPWVESEKGGEEGVCWTEGRCPVTHMQV